MDQQVQTQRKVWPPKDCPVGLVCPRCNCTDLRVLNTRYTMGRVVRYRSCRHCGRRVTTYEVTPSMLASSTFSNGSK
jgi:hypothetical protein